MRRKKGASKITTRTDTSSKAKKVRKRKTKIVRVSKAPKTRNMGTMTEYGFWSWIRSALRKKSMSWKPIGAAREKAKIAYTGPNKRRQFSYICSVCKGEFAGKDVVVHHIDPCGTLTCAQDLPAFVEKLFCEVDGLAVICGPCHDKEHIKI